MNSRSKNPQRWKSVRKYKKMLKQFARWYFGLRGKELKRETERKLHKELEKWLLAGEKKLDPWKSIQVFNRFRNFNGNQSWQYVWERKWRETIPRETNPEDILAAATVMLSRAVA